MGADTRKAVLDAIRADGRYAPDAYDFLHEGLAYTTRTMLDIDVDEGPHHVTGEQLL